MNDYSNVRATVDNAGDDTLSRVEVNQRALIDKILARYASQGAVYRELIQNSNDADATQAEIYYTTSSSLSTTAEASTTNTNNTESTNSNIVTQVVYRNNGIPFRIQDWDRLKKIAEGNPDVSKVGAFGVGAYTMFSICEEPMVISGNSALAFVWKGDALWTKTILYDQQQQHKYENTTTKNDPKQQWTTFVLPSRDPYPVPNLLQFGEFLCASLTFTAKLMSIKVFVNNEQKLHIQKTIAQEPRLVQTPKSTTNTASSLLWSMWSSSSQSSSGATTTSSKGVFSLAKSKDGYPAIYESIHRMTVSIVDDHHSNHNNNKKNSSSTSSKYTTTHTATLDARYVSATAKTNISTDMARRMERVTKKNPPSTVDIQIFLNAGVQHHDHHHKSTTNKAEKIVQSFLPRAGQGRIFIGFRTSQTTGLGAHLAAPFVPTVEREAMDLQDPTLRIFNTELLEFSGILMRLTLEHTMLNVIGVEWESNTQQRITEEQILFKKLEEGKNSSGTNKLMTDTSENSSQGNNNTKINNIDEIDDDYDDDDTVMDDDDTSSGVGGGSSSGVLMGFARFMARGVKKSIVSVAKTVGNLVESNLLNADTLLYPPDPRPLCSEERQAVTLMQSFCPQQSTPDPTVGTCLATGFSRCLPNQAPPVLTRSGIMRGDLARLPCYGIESFCQHNTVRNVVVQNCEEYHTVIARCQKLTINDLYESIQKQILDETTAIKLIRWWVRYCRVEPLDSTEKGMALKELIRFYPDDDDDATKRSNNLVPKSSSDGTTSEVKRTVIELKDWYYYFEKESYYATHTMLPLPDTVITRRLQDKIGLNVLSDSCLYRWFSTIPIEVWAEFISNCSCMTDAKPEDELIRVQVLACLSQEYSRRLQYEREVFGGFCHSLFANKRCIPFDSTEPTSYAAEYPGDLYLASAELQAFQGIGGASFYKVAGSLRNSGVTDEFLLTLGVRKSVSIDFLFSNLETLKWSEDPKALIEYLRTATLTRNDVNKLATTQYLPAENDNTRTYAPAQLYLPNSQLRIFPFIKMLQWPSESELSEKSSNGQFLVKLGMKTIPPLGTILEYASRDDLKQEQRMKCLDFVCDRLGPHGIYHSVYNQMSHAQKKQYRFLPCTIHNPIEAIFSPDQKSLIVREVRHSPVSCCSDEICGVMGFPIIDPKLMGTKKNSKLYGSLFQCAEEPEAHVLLNQLGQLVLQAKTKQEKVPPSAESVTLLEATFASIFKYLSHRSAELNISSTDIARMGTFIPVKVDDKTIEWYRPDQVFFKRKDDNHDNITAELFRVIEFNPFLAAAGVKEEATTKDLFLKVIASPENVLRTLGSEKKYRSLLRRIAANPPFHPARIPPEVKKSPFLLAYTVKPTPSSIETAKDEHPDKTGETTAYHLAKASDIYIIDNSFFARMFPANRAPPESDLEDFYVRLGSRYISQSVDRRFEIVGKPSDNTPLTQALKERLEERGPLLVSPSVTSRPLVPNAASVIDSSRLEVYEARNLLAVYSLDGTVRRNQTTCCSREIGTKKNAIYVVDDFDWFDVGYAIGDLILKRCQLEDAFFISSLLEAPLEQLRSRGFPVDRILQPVPDSPPPRPKPAPEKTTTVGQIPPPTIAQVPPPTIAPIPPPKAPAPATTNGAGPRNANPSPEHPSSSNGKLPSVSGRQPAAVKGATNEKDAKSDGAEAKAGDLSKDGLHEILMQMFPDADPDFIKASLGSHPSIDDVRILAEQMTTGNYPKAPTPPGATNNTVGSASVSSMDDDSSMRDKKKSGGFGKKLGRALGFGSKLPKAPGLPTNLSAGFAYQGDQGYVPPSSITTQQQAQESRDPVSPANDAQSQESLERMLENTVNSSSQVNADGVHSDETKLTSIPKELDHDCEVIPAQSLKPYLGPRGNGKTRNGIRVFSSRLHPVSETFLMEYDPVLECFANVLERLCVGVFGLNVNTLAIFHEPAGKHTGSECFSYWYMTIAHELAHHMVSGHTREHGFYTESYATHYLPKLLTLLKDL